MSKGLISDLDKFQNAIQPDTVLERDKVVKQVPFDQYFKWVHDSYSSQVPKINTKTNYNGGMLKRVFNITSIKYTVLPNMLYGNTIVFKLYDMSHHKEINYATLFCENVSELPDKLEKNIYPEQRIGNIVLQYFSISPSFISCDGEYRTNFIRYSDFIKAKIKYPEIWNELEMYVMKSVERRQWNYYSSYFHGRESENNNELERVIKSNLIAQSLLTLSWFHAIYKESLGLSESHMNATFKEIMFGNLKTDFDFLEELIKKYGEKEVEMVKVLTSYIIHPIFGSKTKRYIPLGYKMIPLNLREIQNPLKLHYKSWREFLIANKCNDLVINQISPGFPITLDWFLIKKTHKGLFDNKSQYERLRHSELARSILSSLYEAQRSTYFASTNIGNSSKSIKEWVSNKFKYLHDKIRDPIEFSVDEIIMSDITLVFSNEYVGRTIADTVNIVKKSKTYDQMIGTPFHNFDMFKKYMFEICYNLLVINKKLSIVHGDFHLNNATIGLLYTNEEPNAGVVYQLDETHKYVFTNNGYFACIIDFSRSMINPEDYENLKDEGMPDNFQIIKDYDQFEASELQNLLYWYLQLYPNKAKQKEELHVMFKHNAYASFKLLTAMDLYMFTARFNALLSKQNIGVNKKCFELLEKINKLSEVYITTEINNLMRDQTYGAQVLAADFPIETIIKKCFVDNMIDVAKNKRVITDYYVLDNDLSKSLSKYEKFPDVIKYSKYYEGNKLIDIDVINRNKKETRDTYEKRKLHNLEHLKFLAHKYLDAKDAEIS